jgi:hypothetical protein
VYASLFLVASSLEQAFSLIFLSDPFLVDRSSLPYANSGATNQSSYLALYQITISDSSLFAQAAEDFETMRKHIQDLKSTRSLGIEVEGAFDHTVHRKLVSNTPPRTIALLSSDEVCPTRSTSLRTYNKTAAKIQSLTRFIFTTVCLGF